MRIMLVKGGSKFVIRWDEYGDLDTIEKDGTLIPSTNRDARIIVNNADKIRAGNLPKGFSYEKR